MQEKQNERVHAAVITATNPSQNEITCSVDGQFVSYKVNEDFFEKYIAPKGKYYIVRENGSAFCLSEEAFQELFQPEMPSFIQRILPAILATKGPGVVDNPVGDESNQGQSAGRGRRRNVGDKK